MELPVITLERFDCHKSWCFTPLITEFVASHSNHLHFNDNFVNIFEENMKQTKDSKLEAVFVASESSKPVGLITGVVNNNPPLLQPEKIGYIPILVVLTDYRRRAIGLNLFLALKEWFETVGISQIELYTLLDNPSAKGFWESVGFGAYLERRRLCF